MPGAENARNFTQCDSLLIGDKCGAHTTPYVEVRNNTADVEHEAFTSKVSEDQLFYCQQRGLSSEEAHSMIINGFCREVFRKLPLEFSVEATRLLELNLEGGGRLGEDHWARLFRLAPPALSGRAAASPVYWTKRNVNA